ncbi:MAG: dipicolinate synthase subunit B [Clostridia bacterium]|nr:dipicolinate synthase subunit B [Clostridia bacterium]
MEFEGIKIGIAVTGSFCTFDKIKEQIQRIVDEGADVTPIFSFHAAGISTRFADAKEYVSEIERMTNKKAILTIEDAEPLGPKELIDLLLIAPCSGNTLAKLSNGITDTPVLMAAKAQMRNNKPVVIFLSTNDALGLNLKNIGILLNTKGVYFVPFGQDNSQKKPKSMISSVDAVIPTITKALEGEQLQPIILS